MGFSPGELVGDYEILGLLGSGGHGQVYRVRNVISDRQEAMKVVLHEASKQAQLAERFLREIKLHARLHHPNITSLHAALKLNDQIVMVLEYVEGVSVTEMLSKGPIDCDQATAIISQVLAALDYAHQHGVLHRDVKPDNIIVNPKGVAKLTDLGIAKSDAVENLTETGGLVGSFNYMSPEQIRSLAPDARSDIYSVGITLYEMVTGVVPFDGPSEWAVMRAHLEKEAKPPCEVNPDVSMALSAVILKAMARKPEDRFQSAKEFRQSLEKAIGQFRTSPSGRMAKVPTPPAPAPTPAPPKPRPIAKRLWIAAAALAVLCVLGLVALLRTRTSPLESVAVLPFTNVSGDPSAAYLSDGVAENLINSLAQAPALSVRSFSSVQRYKGKDLDPQAVGRELNVKALVTGRLRQQGDNVSIDAELIDVANNRQLAGYAYSLKIAGLAGVESEISQGISKKLRFPLSAPEQERIARRSTGNPAAYQLYLQGRYEWNRGTLEGLQRSIEIFQEASQKDSRFALAYAGLADSYASLADYNVLSALEVIPRVKEAAGQALALDDSLAEAHDSLAWVSFIYDWDWPAAEREFKRAIALNASDATAHLRYGEFLMAQGRFDESLAQIHQASDLDPLSPAINLALATRSYYAGRYSDAVDQCEKALSLDTSFVPAHTYLGRAYELKADYTGALAEFRKAVQLSGEDTSALAALGYAEAVSNQSDAARKVLQELDQRSHQTYVQPMWRAALYMGLGDADQAFDWLQKAYQDRSGWLVYLRVDPLFAPLRSDARFAALLHRIGLGS